MIRNNTKILFFILLQAYLLVFASSKIYSKVIPIMTLRRDSGWNFIDRMTMRSGLLQLQFQIKISAKDFRIGSFFNFQFVAIPADIWPSQAANKCDKSKFTNQQKEAKIYKEIAQNIILNEGNLYQYKGRIRKEISSQGAYNFVLRDCSQSLLKQNFARGSNVQIKLNTLLNGKHRSSTQEMYTWFLPFSIVLCLMSILFLKKKKQQQQQNWIKYILKISLWIGLAATLWKYLGYLIYAHLQGQDYQFFDFMYLLLYSVSDSVIIVLLLLLGFGWTVTFRSTKDFDLYVPLASMLGMINVIMTTLNKVTDGDHDKYHIFDSVPAYIMIFFRLLGFCIFIVGVIRCFLKTKPEDSKIKKYFLQLGLLGTIYLTFIPSSLMFITFIESHNRKQFMFFLVEASKYVISIWLGYLSGSKNSIYRNITESSFMEKEGKYY